VRPRRLRWPRGLRERLLLSVVLAVGLALGIAAVAFNLILHTTLRHDAVDLARSRATAALATLDTAGGHVVRTSPNLALPTGPVWVFDGRREIDPPAAPPAVERLARELATGPPREHEAESVDVLLASVPVTVDGRRIGTVVGAASVSPLERTQKIALVASAILVALLLVVVVLATRWTLAAALRPVARMTADAEDWSEHDLDRRFDAGEPHDEITRLAATLDGLLDRLSASLRRERLLTAELSHELRTPLAKIITQGESTLRRERSGGVYRERIDSMLGHARGLAETLETLLAAARNEANGRARNADLGDAARAAADDCGVLAAERGVRLSVESPPDPVRADLDPALLARILHPLVENACRYARSAATLVVTNGGGAATLVVEDDGPGLAAGEAEAIFEPGVRGSAGRADGGAGAGLGLTLARRLARAAGGEVEADPAAAGGRFRVTLPARPPGAG
jgi:signal transduction histidine kinase